MFVVLKVVMIAMVGEVRVVMKVLMVVTDVVLVVDIAVIESCKDNMVVCIVES